MSDIIIIGGGTYTWPIVELAQTLGFDVPYILSPTPTSLEHVGGIAVREGPVTDIPRGGSVAIAIGNCRQRRDVAQETIACGLRLPPLVHPRAHISESASIGDGTCVHQFASVWSQATIGAGCLLSPHSSVAHHTTIGDWTLVSSGAAVGAGISLGEECFIGMSATVVTGVVTVEDRTVVGAGATVIADIHEPGGTYIGTPARLLERHRDARS